jgi:hypothetical protein
MSFAKLLGDLEALQKSLPTGDEDDEKIKGAAADGEQLSAEADVIDGEPGEGDPAADEGKGEEMAKSFQFELEDGTHIDAVDGTQLVKSLMDRLEKTEADATSAVEQVVEVLKGQDTLIKSLQADVKRLSGEGRGRKAVVSVSEKPAIGTMQKSEPAGVSEQEFMAKALTAQAAGRISALDVSVCENSFAKGLKAPADIVARVLG